MYGLFRTQNYLSGTLPSRRWPILILSIQFQLWIKHSNSHIWTCEVHSVSQYYKSLPYHAVVSFCSPIKSSLCFSHALDVWFHWSTVDLPEETLLRKTDFPFPHKWQGVRFCASLLSPYWAFLWLELAQILCTLSQLLWVHMCSCTAVSRKYKIYLYLYVCVCASVCASKCRCPWRPKAVIWSPGNGITGQCETPQMGAGKGTLVFWKNCKSSYLLKYLPSPLFAFLMMANLTRVRCNLKEALVCISLMIKDIKHFCVFIDFIFWELS